MANHLAAATTSQNICLLRDSVIHLGTEVPSVTLALIHHEGCVFVSHLNVHWFLNPLHLSYFRDHFC